MTARPNPAEESPVEAMPVDPALLIADPHGALARFRALTPVIRTAEHRYTVLRARDIADLMRDSRMVQVEGADYARFNQVPEGCAARFLAEFFLFANGTDHRAKRGPFATTFSHGAIRSLRPQVRETAERIAADLPRGESFDFLACVAGRAPAEMIAAILGLPREDAPELAEQVYVVAGLLSPDYAIERHAEIEAAAQALHEYIKLQLSLRITAPRDDLLSRTVGVWREMRTMTFDTLAFQVMGLILGGSDTTRGAIAMTTALLLQHPAQWAALRAEPELVSGAVNEGLRYDPSVGSTVRFAAEPVEVSGITIPAGRMIALSTLSALRDPDLYPEPDRFDIRRAAVPRTHMVFGGGPHRCLGEMLARVEMEEMIAALVRRVPEIELVEAPRLEGYGGIRTITPMRTRIPG